MSKGYDSKSIRGKLRVYKYLSKSRSILPYLPYTKPFSEKHLHRMLNNFPEVYIKPDYGAQGFGIYKVEKAGDDFIVRTSKATKKYTNSSEVYQFILSHSKQKLIVQKGIRIDKVQGRPYDIRSMIQRKPKGSWTCTGFFAKIGQPNRIVTNYHQGGKIVSMKNLFRSLRFPSSIQKKKIRHLSRLSLKVAKNLSSSRSGMHELGIDLAYDISGHPYILEVNSRQPGFYPLRKVNQAAYRRMLSFGASYGRHHG
jgi:glutathione synthase/RimK-type ligase-like ATP-grasp enzyme